ncbi:MAG: hypothetical protein SGILL_008385 [Bacillariaceae sp.]
MPAISASRKAASTAASALKSHAGVTRLTKEAAERIFMPAFSAATEKVIIPASLKVNQKRNFSSAAPHQHDKVRQQFQGNVSDYWNSHPGDHFNLYKVDSERIRSFQVKPPMSFANASESSKVEDGLIDLWSEHSDSHFAQPAKDFWAAHPESHL